MVKKSRDEKRRNERHWIIMIFMVKKKNTRQAWAMPMVAPLLGPPSPPPPHLTNDIHFNTHTHPWTKQRRGANFGVDIFCE